MEDQLEDVCKTYRERVERLFGLIEETHRLEEEIKIRLDLPPSTRLISESDEKFIREALSQTVVIPVIGERNSGKSSLINEILHCNLVPVEDTGSTSRIVRIKYSAEPYIQVVQRDGHAKAGTHRKLDIAVSENCYDEVLRDLAVLRGDERHDETLVSETVEVGINHPVLECGVEFLDSPGRNENQMLNQVVDKMTKNTIPILIYVIDGNMLLRPADLASIQFFKENCPRTTVLYVCSKVDVDEQAERMDMPSDEEDEEPWQPNRSSSDLSKAALVESDLCRHSILDEQSSKYFHPLSVREVRISRKARLCAHDPQHELLLNFQQFKSSLALALKHYYEGVLSSVESRLISCHSQCFGAFKIKHSLIEEETVEMAVVLQNARKLGKDLHTMVREIVFKNRLHLVEVIRRAVQISTEKVKETTIGRPSKIAAYDILLSLPDVQTQLGTSIPDDDNFLQLHASCYEVRNFIVNTVCSQAEKEFANMLKRHITTSAGHVMGDSIEALDNPTLKRNLQSIYQLLSYDSDHIESTRSSLLELVSSLVEVSKTAIAKELRQVYSVVSMAEMALNVFQSAESDARIANIDHIVSTLASELDFEDICDCIIDSCCNHLDERNKIYLNALDNMEAFAAEMVVQEDQHYLATVSLLISNLGLVEVRNHGLNFEVTRGKLRKGEELNRGKHSRIHLSKHDWNLPSEHIIRVVQQQGEKWQQNLCSLYYAFNCVPSEYLTKIYGWTFPSPDEIHIAMERADGSLDQLDLSLRQRLMMMLDVVKGMETIHASGFIYNNLKAKNVLVMPDKTAKINTCKGRYEFLHGRSPYADIQQLGELLLWIHRPQTTMCGPVSLLGINRPSDISVGVWSLIKRCMADNKQISVSEIRGTLESILNELQT
ncbi:dual serine/threonine and tyrosine protein kinase-like [Ptychodera flava]|uniref:dual serine/threonine and tyrosine protein kinase-like n=1 Tax=Ptychodera flava TaxID=63121 RepID=UPI00396A4815